MDLETDGDRLLFSGFRLERVLERIAEISGPDAQIVNTRRWIRGGIGGFFGTECFTVEVEPNMSGPSGAMPGQVFAEVLAEALAQQVDGTERAGPEAESLMGSGVIAVVGEFDPALWRARQIASDEGLDEGETLVYSSDPVVGHPAWLCISDVLDATTRRERWSRDSRTRIVVLPCAEALGADGGSTDSSEPELWLESALTALRPDRLVRVAVDAPIGSTESAIPTSLLDELRELDPGPTPTIGDDIWDVRILEEIG